MLTRPTSWFLFVCLVSALVGTLIGTAYAGSNGPWRDSSPYLAVVRCENIAEDSAAHLRLVDYAPLPDGRIKLIYRCEKNSY